jgi:hypothetical protein
MSELRIVTGMTVDELAAPGAPPLPSTQRVGEPVGHAQPCSAGMELCDKRQAARAMARPAMPPAGLAGVRGRRFAGAARNAANTA